MGSSFGYQMYNPTLAGNEQVDDSVRLRYLHILVEFLLSKIMGMF